MKDEQQNKTVLKLKKADQYNDPKHNYLRYWQGRDYEHAAEEAAIKKFLKDRHFKHAVDVGGGYGRLCILLERYADKVTLAEPSRQQLDIAKDFLKDHPAIERKLMQAANLKFSDASVDLLVMVRVIHHLPDPYAEFAEIARVLAPGGFAIVEVANYLHARNRLKHVLSAKKFSTQPVDIRSIENRREGEIAFVNHNPHTIIKQLAHAGLKVESVLSVSNLRSTTLKKTVPRTALLALEKLLQPALAGTFFGPSIFFLIRKA